MANDERSGGRGPAHERRSRVRGIDWEWEGSAPADEEPRGRTDRGYDEAAHRGGRYGVAEGHGGVFGTTGGGTYPGGFQIENRTGSPRDDRDEPILHEREGLFPETSWRGGPHRGRGPRGYRRPDARILDEIHERLEGDGWVDAREIEVEVRDGEVTLAGSIPSRAMRWRAEEIVSRISGVDHVRNDLRIRPERTRE